MNNIDKKDIKIGFHRWNPTSQSNMVVDDIRGYDLIVWFGDDPIPQKDKGCVLICFGTESIGESLRKVFKNRANAVICPIGNMYHLVDALGNLWCRTDDEIELMNHIYRLYNWTKSSIRRESVKTDSYIPYSPENLPEMGIFCNIIKSVSDKVENERGGRYFGNASTRCSKMFPSVRSLYNDSKYFQYILVSKRNVPKDRIRPEDFVITKLGNVVGIQSNVVQYFGEDKPSVDTPSQIWLYSEYPNINYMIHGHAYIQSNFMGFNLISSTEKYCSCGDLREVDEIRKLIPDKETEFFIVNLTNHGFIIATDTLSRMKDIVEHMETKFVYRKIGEEIPKL